jgi:hypothetical protein
MQFGFLIIQSFGTAGGLIMTFDVNKMKKLEQKVKPLTEQVQKYGGFQNFLFVSFQ